MKKLLSKVLAGLLAAVLALGCLAAAPKQAKADEVTYTLNAEKTGLPGVYKTKAAVGAELTSATIGIPSIAKQNLQEGPTTESPAIITGAAVNYETKTGPTEFTPIPGAQLIAPYSYFRWSVLEEQGADGTTHKKLSGFDGSYYIVRVDVSDIIAGKSGYLHVKQESNKALMVAMGIEGTTFADALGNKTGSYSLADNAAALKDTTGEDRETPYFDVIIMSSGKLAAGANAGAADAPSADIKLSFYVDDTADYNPELTYDPASTDVNHAANVLKKFYDDEKAAAEGTNRSSYTVKGSDLEIDVMVDEQNTMDGVTEYWSLTNAIDWQAYNAHSIRLISEVPVLDGLNIEGTADNHRSVILDVNSFDIQIANDTEAGRAKLSVSNNAQLKIADSTNTSGAELAIGNNAFMEVGSGGTLIIDQSCTFEVEYDAASTTTGSTSQTYDITNGEMIIHSGGRLVNNGVINIEGTEGKPLAQSAAESQQGETTAMDMRPARIIVEKGGTIENSGCISLKGELYVMGTLINKGRYAEYPIIKTDPDRGETVYHRGIQITWKDDVRKEGVKPGVLYLGIDPAENIDRSAVLNNYGDIVIVPGSMEVYGTLNNVQNPVVGGVAPGHIYLGAVSEAIVPITPTVQEPLIVEITVSLEKPVEAYVNFVEGCTFNADPGTITGASVALIHNGVLGDLTETEKNTIDKMNGAWVKTDENGVADLSFTGICRNKNGWWYAENGVVSFNVNSIRQNENGWWKITDSKVDFGYTGVARNENGWWRVEKGKVNFQATGIYQNENGWWRVEGGKVNFQATGIYQNENGWWRVEGGKVNFQATGIYQNENGWWRVENGKVNFSAEGLYQNENGWWYVKGGKVQFDYSGLQSNENGTWKIVNGKVTERA